MYKLKQVSEDFVVVEISSIKVGAQGKYLYLWLKKKGLNTLDVIKELAKKLRMKEKDLGFAGSKDKHAYTEQMISVFGKKKEEVEKISLENASLKFRGFGLIPVSLGDLFGNQFRIVIRNLEKEKFEPISFAENYFDEQRFSGNNIAIGKHLLKKEFGKAALLADDFKVRKHLEEKPHDYVGALKSLPIRLLRMYVNSYQSYLWNRTVARYFEREGLVLRKIQSSSGELVFISDAEKFKGKQVPLVGFGHSDFRQENGDKAVQEIIEEVMREENLSYSDFIIKPIPELTLEGEPRNILMEVKDLKIGRKAEDELNSGKKKVEVSFTLPKGCYATMVVKRMIS